MHLSNIFERKHLPTNIVSPLPLESCLEQLEIRFPREPLQTSLLLPVLKASRSLQQLSLDSATISCPLEFGLLLQALKGNTIKLCSELLGQNLSWSPWAACLGASLFLCHLYCLGGQVYITQFCGHSCLPQVCEKFHTPDWNSNAGKTLCRHSYAWGGLSIDLLMLV